MKTIENKALERIYRKDLTVSFYIISIKKDKGKVIHNSEVIDEIKKEIKRLEND